MLYSIGMKENNSVKAAIDFFGGRRALATVISASPQFVGQLLRGERPVPPLKAKIIDKRSGGKIPATALCPRLAELLNE